MFVYIEILILKLLEIEGSYSFQILIPLAIFLFSVLLFSPIVIFKVPKPSLASVLSILLPGYGHLYLGYLKTGIVIFIAWLSVSYITLTNENPFLFLYMITIVPLLDSKLVYEAPNFKLLKFRSDQMQRLATAKYKTLMDKFHKGYMPAVDTNVMMHDPLVLIAIHKDSDSKLYVSKKVVSELDGLKNNKQKETRDRAQLAFDIIELFQKDGRLILVEIPSRNYRESWNLTGSSDDIILSSYLFEVDKKKLPIAFYSNDKGARITARNTGMPILMEGLA